MNGIPLEAELGANVLFVTNEDKPGFIGNLGRTLGEAGINIATFDLGRIEAGNAAVALINTDEPVDEGTLEKVRSLPNVVQAESLHL